MKVVGISGTPRKGGNTECLVRECVSYPRLKHMGFLVHGRQLADKQKLGSSGRNLRRTLRCALHTDVACFYIDSLNASMSIISALLTSRDG